MLEPTPTPWSIDRFTVHTEYAESVAIVHPNGPIDVENRKVLDDSLDVLERDVVVDLTGVSFLDSSAIAVLVSQQQRLGDAGWRFRMVNPNAHVRNILTLVGLDGWLEY
jgi:anti-sigma B factor antagonist